MRLPKPPTLSQISQDDISFVFLGYLSEHLAIDNKGRYLSWDDFRYRNPNDSKRRWLAQKLNRQAIMQWLEIGDYRLSYCLPHSLQMQLLQIEHSYQHWHWSIDAEHLLLEEPITSAQLEGACTTRKIAKEMLNTKRLPVNKHERMIVNNHHLMQEVKKHTNQSLSIELILRLHKIATNGAIENNAIAGELRKDDNIIIADYDGNTIHQPPAYQKLSMLMQAYCDFANNKNESMHPIIKAIILHFLIGFIHPFGDGNGRTARALFYWFLQKSGYKHFDYISISRLLHKAPKQYTQSYIDVETDELDMTYFIAYQLKIISRAIIDLQNLVETKEKETTVTKPVIHHDQLNIHQYQLLMNTPSNQILTAKEVAISLNISDGTARKILNELESLGFATTVKNGRGKGYLLSQ